MFEPINGHAVGEGLPAHVFNLRDLSPERRYHLRGLGSDFTREVTGSDLMTSGLKIAGLREEESLLLLME